MEEDEVMMAIAQYQRERVNDVRQWYESIYRPLDGHAPVSIRYMALWAVFNALYIIADLPKITIRSVSVDGGITKPFIRGRDEDKKLRFIARKLSQDTKFIASIMHEHIVFITHLAQRTPQVQQPPNTTAIQFEHEHQSYTLNFDDLHGIASIDNRIYLENGKVLFQYHHLDLDLTQDNLPKDCRKFFLQLLYMLYQLRNNIVHGGSAAFFMQKTALSSEAIRLLDTIVWHLIDHPELLDQDGE